MKIDKWKKYIFPAVSLILIALMCFSVLKTMQIGQRIELYTESLQNASKEQEKAWDKQAEQLADFSESVTAELEKGASLYTDVCIEYQKINEQNNEVSVKFYVVPKRMTSSTTIQMAVRDQVVPLMADGLGYSAVVSLPLFLEKTEYALLIMQEKDIIQKELIKCLDISYLYRKVLPVMDAELPMYYDYNRNLFRLDSILSIKFKETEDVVFDVTYDKIEWVVEIDGKEIEREDLTKEVAEAKDKYEQDVQKEYHISRTENLNIYVEMTDTLGYMHRILLLDWNCTTDEDVYIPQVGDELIMDAQKKILNMEYVIENNKQKEDKEMT